MEWRVGSVMGGCGREGRLGARFRGTFINTGLVYRHPASPPRLREWRQIGGWQTLVCMHTLTRLNKKGHWQIVIGRAESGRGGLGPQTGFVPIWEFVAVHAFIMKLNEASKCLAGHGQNTAPLMFPRQICCERELFLNHKVSNINSELRFYDSLSIYKQFSHCICEFFSRMSDNSTLQKN